MRGKLALIFVGTVSRIPEANPQPGQTFMSYDDMHRANFFLVLDNPEDAARFEGERAKVQGVIDSDGYAIDVQSIDLFSPLKYLRVGK